MKWYRGRCVKEIYWGDKSYRQGDLINVIEDDMRLLTQAGVIGDIKKIQSGEIEDAMLRPPEHAMKPINRKVR